MVIERFKVASAALVFAAAFAIPLWAAPAGADGMGGSAQVNSSAAADGSTSGTSSMPGMGGGSAPASSGSAAGDQASQPADAAAMDAAMAARDKSFPAATKGLGGQLLAPTVLADGTKQYEMTAAVTPWEIEPGKVVQAWTFNGTVPGPTIHVNVGDRVKVIIHNRLPESTSVHWHGLPGIPNNMDGVSDVTQDPIKPGTDFTYAFTPTAPAVSWYHSHHDGTKQVTSGLYGAILVGDMPVPAGVKVSQLVNFDLQDAGTIGLTINGKSFPATAPVQAKLGDWVEVNYINAGTMSHPMHLHGVAQTVIAKDGYPVPAPYQGDTIDVAPGERYTVLIHADQPGKWAWHCHIFPHSEGSQGMFGLFTEMWIS